MPNNAGQSPTSRAVLIPKPGLQEMTVNRMAGMQDHLNKDRAGTPRHIPILRVKKPGMNSRYVLVDCGGK